MIKRLARAILIVGFFSIVGAMGYGTWLTSQGWRVLFPAAHGEKIGEFEGVTVFGNDGSNIRGDYGLQFECVEFVNRFYAVRLGHKNMTQLGNADDYFWNPGNKALVAYPNGGETPPQKYDILVFDGGENDGDVGHIAIITAVDAKSVSLIQQNAVARKHNLFARDIVEDRLVLTNDHGRWTIEQPHKNRLPIAGWSRAKGSH